MTLPVHPALGLCPSCVSEKLGANQNIFSRKKTQMPLNQAKGIKSKIRECKLRCGVNLQGALKQKGVKEGLGVFVMV